MDIMEELLALRQAQGKLLKLYRGQQVEGEITGIGGRELVLDLGTKSDGIISTKDIPASQLQTLKIGDKLTSFVVMVENESGQTLLSLHPAPAPKRGGLGRSRGVANLNRFAAYQNQKRQLTGQVMEVNRGGLIVEAEGSPREAGVRGFLPNSQVGFELLSSLKQGMSDLVGQNIRITVIEIDAENNRLIFSQRGQISEEVLKQLKSFKPGQKATGKIVAILPFGLVVDIAPSGKLGTGGTEGLVFISDVAWEKIEDLSTLFKVGQELEVVVTGIDEELGRLNLSLKQLTEDPFNKIAQNFPADEIVKGEITGVTEAGVSIKLEEGVEGLLKASKMESGSKYEVGQKITVLVDSVDTKRRRVNLAPVITSTAGLIYK